jgi:Zn-dependent protease with chaperone function
MWLMNLIPAHVAPVALAALEKNKVMILSEGSTMHSFSTVMHNIIAIKENIPQRFFCAPQSHHLKIIFLGFFCSLLQACSSSMLQFERPTSNNQQDELTRYVANQEKLYRIAAPLLVKNAPLCKSATRNIMGFTAKNQYSYSSELAQTANKLFKLTDHLQVVSILEGGGAERAGIKRGDIFLKVQNQTIPTGINAEIETARLLSTLMSHSANLPISIERNKQVYNFNIPLTLACAFNLELGNSDVIHAFNDGRRILITRGMLQVLNTDAELAAIIAREIAHSALKHTASLQMTASAAQAIDGLIPVLRNNAGDAAIKDLKAMPSNLDQAADRVAIAMLVRAGYEAEQLPLSLQKLAAIKNNEKYTVAHPLTNERLKLMQEVIVQVKQKPSVGKSSAP